METRLTLQISPQPDETTCGPTCLHAVYRYYGDDIELERVIQESAKLKEGGTLAGWLGCHALKRGYEATIYTWNVQVWDPTWFRPGARPLSESLRLQMAAKDSPKLHLSSLAYLEYLDLGGQVRMVDLTADLIRKYLKKEIPILAGLSATWLYQAPREYGPKCVNDDIRGLPAGHFVVLCGYDRETRSVLVADPLYPNPLAKEEEHYYVVDMDRLVSAILLGILTYDSKLLVIQPRKGERSAHPDHS